MAVLGLSSGAKLHDQTVLEIMTAAPPEMIYLRKVISFDRGTILTGKERGEQAAVKLELADKFAELEADAVIVVPDTIVGVSSSFANGLFREAIKAIGGLDRFLEKVKFDASPTVIGDIIVALERGWQSPLDLS